MSRFPKIGLRLALAVGLIALATAREAAAGFTTYTSSSAFKSALATGKLGLSTEDYSSGFSNGELVNDGSTFHGLTYTFQHTATLTGGVIQNTYNNLTGLSLGGNQSSGQQFFFDGDRFTITFAQPVLAVGLYFNVNPSSGTYGLITSAGSASTDSAAYDLSTFVFAGGISTTPFTSATFFSTSGGGNTAVYNVPAILFAAPEPTSFALTGLGLLALAIGRKVRTRRAPSPR
jgi:hypothetical protein